MVCVSVSVCTFIAALELSGTPSLYFPVSMPHAKGDQVMAPTPEEDRGRGELLGARVSQTVPCFHVQLNRETNNTVCQKNLLLLIFLKIYLENPFNVEQKHFSTPPH